MINYKPEYKFSTQESLEKLADYFGYSIDSSSQDWTIEVAESNNLADYINAYCLEHFDDETKFSLMEMILQALNEQKSYESINNFWGKIKPMLIDNFKLHEFTIYYWCCWDISDNCDIWNITQLMRELWKEQNQ